VTTKTLTFTALNWYIPHGATGTGVDDTILDGHKTANITISVDTSASAAAYTNVTAKTVVVTNLDNELSRSTITGPTAVTTSQRPTITWAPLVGAVRYEVWVNNLSTGQNPAFNDTNVTATQWTPPADLPINAYRIWVRALDVSGRGNVWSSAADFRIVTAPTAIGPVAPPAIGPVAPTLNRTPTFTWTAVTGAVTYNFEVRNVATNAIVHKIQNLTTPLVSGGSYRVWIRAISSAGDLGLWSAMLNFTVADATSDVGTDTDLAMLHSANSLLTKSVLQNIICSSDDNKESYATVDVQSTTMSEELEAEVAILSDRADLLQIDNVINIIVSDLLLANQAR